MSGRRIIRLLDDWRQVGQAITTARRRWTRFRVFDALPWGHPDKLDEMEAMLATFPPRDREKLRTVWLAAARRSAEGGQGR